MEIQITDYTENRKIKKVNLESTVMLLLQKKIKTLSLLLSVLLKCIQISLDRRNLPKLNFALIFSYQSDIMNGLTSVALEYSGSPAS